MTKTEATVETIGDWEVSFINNVHMYCHSMSVSNGSFQIDIPCEDLPTNDKMIGIWLHSLDISSSVKGELQEILLEWVKNRKFKCKLYISQNEFVLSE